MVMCLKDADRMASSVDCNQTAPSELCSSSLIRVCTVCPDLSVRKLRIIKVILEILT